MLLYDDDNVDAYFALLCGDASAVGVGELRRAARDLKLDTDGARGFTTDNLESMIDCFDQGAKGVLTLNDFRSLMRQLNRAAA